MQACILTALAWWQIAAGAMNINFTYITTLKMETVTMLLNTEIIWVQHKETIKET